MPSEILYFNTDVFQMELEKYLECHTAWYVTAMCPIDDGPGYTTGIYVTVKKEA